jgi:hypothetical protein
MNAHDAKMREFLNQPEELLPEDAIPNRIEALLKTSATNHQSEIHAYPQSLITDSRTIPACSPAASGSSSFWDSF